MQKGIANDWSNHLWAYRRPPDSSFTRRREPSKNNELDTRLHGHDEFFEVPLSAETRALIQSLFVIVSQMAHPARHR